MDWFNRSLWLRSVVLASLPWLTFVVSVYAVVLGFVRESWFPWLLLVSFGFIVVSLASSGLCWFPGEALSKQWHSAVVAVV